MTLFPDISLLTCTSARQVTKPFGKEFATEVVTVIHPFGNHTNNHVPSGPCVVQPSRAPETRGVRNINVLSPAQYPLSVNHRLRHAFHAVIMYALRGGPAYTLLVIACDRSLVSKHRLLGLPANLDRVISCNGTPFPAKPKSLDPASLYYTGLVIKPSVLCALLVNMRISYLPGSNIGAISEKDFVHAS